MSEVNKKFRDLDSFNTICDAHLEIMHFNFHTDSTHGIYMLLI